MNTDQARRLMYLAAAGSLALFARCLRLRGLGYAPCKLCLWQRWPHAAAIALGGLVLLLGPLALLGVAGGLAALVTAGIGVFHTGVEKDWWDGPASCSGNDALAGLSGSRSVVHRRDLNDIVMCDEVAWALPGRVNGVVERFDFRCSLAALGSGCRESGLMQGEFTGDVPPTASSLRCTKRTECSGPSNSFCQNSMNLNRLG